jgi:hypothetical protein
MMASPGRSRVRPTDTPRRYAAVRRRDHRSIHAGLKDFILPLVAIRNRKKGYAVSIVKAGMKVIGHYSGLIPGWTFDDKRPCLVP